MGVGFGSGGPGKSRAPVPAGLTGEMFPAAACGQTSPEFVENDAPGIKLTGLGSRMDYAICVIHLGPWLGSRWLGAASMATSVALRGGACRQARVRVVRGLVLGCWGSVRVRKGKAQLGCACAALQGVRPGGAAVPAAAECRRAVLRPQGWSACYGT